MMASGDIRVSVADAFTDPLTSWIDEMLANNVDSRMAYAALVEYFGHTLAGAAVELGAPLDDIERMARESGAVIAETLTAQLAKMTREFQS